MKKIVGLIKNKYHLLFLLAFTVLFAWTVRYSALFGDDYYYASFVPAGARYFFSENRSHYMLTNGRAWVHMLDELLLAPKGMWAFRLFDTAVAAAAVTAVAYIAANGDRAAFRRTLAASCVLFSLIGIQNAYQSIFWATGSLNYFFPAVLSLLYFIALQRRSRTAPLIALFASSSSEQAAFLALCTTVFFGVMYIKDKKRPNAVFTVSAVLSAVGFILLFAAPGNAVRTGYYPDFYAMTLLQRIAFDLPILRDLVFSRSGAGDLLLFWLFGLFLSSFQRKKAEAIPIAALSLVGAVSYYGWIHLGFPRLFLHLSAAAAAVLLALDVVFSFLCKKYVRSFILFMSAALQLAMLLSPEMGARTVLCSVLLLMIPTAETASNAVLRAPRISLASFGALLFTVTLPGAIVASVCAAAALAAVILLTLKKERYAVFVLALIAAVLAADRMYTLVCGYRENYPVHQKNAESIAGYKENGGGLTVYRLINDDFKYIMPYENGYHEYWFKRCYGIDENAVITYEDFK